MHGERIVLGAHRMQNSFGFANRFAQLFQRVLKLIDVHLFSRTETHGRRSICGLF